MSTFWVNRDYKSALSYYPAHQDMVWQKCPDLLKLQPNSKERYKNPAKAAIMSAFVPGSGKVYAKRWSDGLVSFLLSWDKCVVVVPFF